MKRFLALFLVFSLVALSVPLAAKEKKGADQKFQRFSLCIGEVLLEFPCPSEVEEPEGLAFYQGYLWFASQTQGIYQLDPTDGSVVSWIPMPMECIEIHGLAHDGDYLWAAAYDNNLYQIDPSDGSVMNLIPAPGGGHIEGLAWGDSCLWLSRGVAVLSKRFGRPRPDQAGALCGDRTRGRLGRRGHVHRLPDGRHGLERRSCFGATPAGRAGPGRGPGDAPGFRVFEVDHSGPV